MRVTTRFRHNASQPRRRWVQILSIAVLAGLATATAVRGESERVERGASPDQVIERVTTAVPFPRGLVMLDDELYVLCRGRVRGAGGVSAKVNDQAGTIYRVNPHATEPIDQYPIGEAVKNNGAVYARPTDPPFRLWDRDAEPPESDRRTDRPYCGLRYDDATKSFYICAFSGIDKAKKPGEVSFSKNLTDAILRYDRRTEKWYEIERHRIEAGGNYPHHDPQDNDPPHGWLNGPDNCLALGDWLYAVSKDNSLLVRYDLREIQNDPDAGPPESTYVLGSEVHFADGRVKHLHGHSMLAFHNGWLYLGARTSSVIVRFRLNDDFTPRQPLVAQRVARLDPYDPKTMRSANLTDMDFDEQGRLYVVSAKPSRVYRFTPDPDDVFDARDGRAQPWADIAAATGNKSMKSENVLYHDGWLYVTSGDGYAWQNGAAGTIYRVQVDD